MKNIFVLVAFLVSVVCFADPPPEKVSAPEAFELIAVDNLDCQILTADAPDVFYIQNIAPVETFSSANQSFTQPVTIREVIRRPKDSNLVLLNTAVIPNKQLKELPEVFVTNGVITNNSLANLIGNSFEMNKQNSNYAYPFGADYNSLFS